MKEPENKYLSFPKLFLFIEKFYLRTRERKVFKRENRCFQKGEMRIYFSA